MANIPNNGIAAAGTLNALTSADGKTKIVMESLDSKDLSKEKSTSIRASASAKEEKKHQLDQLADGKTKTVMESLDSKDLSKEKSASIRASTSSLEEIPLDIPESLNKKSVREKFLKLVQQTRIEGSYLEFKKEFNEDSWPYETIKFINALYHVTSIGAPKEQRIFGEGYASFILYGVVEPRRGTTTENRSFVPLKDWRSKVEQIQTLLRDHTKPRISAEFYDVNISKDVKIGEELIPNGTYGMLEIYLEKGISKIAINKKSAFGKQLKLLISQGKLKKTYGRLLEEDCWFARTQGNTLHQSELPQSVKEKLTSLTSSLYPDCCSKYKEFLKSTRKNFNIAIITTITDSKFRKFNSSYFTSFGDVEFDIILNLNENDSTIANDYLKTFVDKTAERRRQFRRINSYQMIKFDNHDLDLLCDRLLTLFVDILNMTEDKAENEVSVVIKEITVRKHFGKLLESLLAKISLMPWTITLFGTSIVNENIVVLVNSILKVLLDDFAAEIPRKISNITFAFIYTSYQVCNHFAKIKGQVDDQLAKLEVENKNLSVTADLNAISTAIEQVYSQNKPQQYVIPSFEGPITISEHEYKDYLSSFEIYYKDIGKNDFKSLNEDEKMKRIAKIKREYCEGGDVSDELFYLHEKKHANKRLYVERSIMKTMKEKIRTILDTTYSSAFGVQRQCLFHLPSTGGSTTARYILYHLRMNYPCVIINRSISKHTFDKIEELFIYCKRLPVLIVCDRPDVSYEGASSILTPMKRSDVRCVVLYVSRRNDGDKTLRFDETMVPQLTESENLAFEELYEEYNTNNEMEIEQLLKQKNTALFLWGMLTFQGDYGERRTKEIVNCLLGNAGEFLQNFFVMMTLIIEYSQNNMDIELASDILNVRIERLDKHTFESTFKNVLKDCKHLVQFSEDSAGKCRVRLPTAAVGNEILQMYFKGDKKKKIHHFVNELENLVKRRNGEKCGILAQIVHSLCNRSDKERSDLQEIKKEQEVKKNKSNFQETKKEQRTKKSRDDIQETIRDQVTKNNRSDFYYSRFFQDVNEAFEGDTKTIIILCERIKAHFPSKHILVDCANSLLHYHNDGNTALEVLHKEFKITDTKNFALAKSEDPVALTKGANLIFNKISNDDKEKENALTPKMLELGHGAIEMLNIAKEIGEETHDIRPYAYIVELKIREFFLRIYFERRCEDESDFDRKLFENNSKETLISLESLETFFSVQNELIYYDSRGLLNIMHLMKPYHFSTIVIKTNSLLSKIPDSNKALLSKIGDSRAPSVQAMYIVELLIKKQVPSLEIPVHIQGLWKNALLINNLNDTDLQTIIDTISSSDVILTKSYMHLIMAYIYQAQRQVSNHEEDWQNKQKQLTLTDRAIEMAQDWIQNYADDFVAEFFKGCLQFAYALSEKPTSQKHSKYYNDCKRAFADCKEKYRKERNPPGHHKIRFYIIRQQSGLAKLKPAKYIEYKLALSQMGDMERFEGIISGERTVTCDSLNGATVHVPIAMKSNLTQSRATPCTFGLALAYDGYCALEVQKDWRW